MKWIKIQNLNEFINYHDAVVYTSLPGQKKIEDELSDTKSGIFSIDGFCAVCKCKTHFELDFMYAFTENDKKKINFRERLICKHCGLNNRIRASIDLLESILKPSNNSSIYITEQRTDLFRWIIQKFPKTIGSEYVSVKCERGSVQQNGLRHEDLTRLSFNNNTFDYILCFDVLEHIPNYRKAISECYRVLKSDGKMIFSVPFSHFSKENIVRATCDESGRINHILPPEYHGDPMNENGCLCFYHFGWDILNDFKSNGFTDANAYLYWSYEKGYLGGLQLLFTAIK